MPVFTLAFYLDHESEAVSICADTRDNSSTVVASINAYNSKHFLEAVRDGDLDNAALWQANVGRNLSLGDFAAVNVARTDLGDLPIDPDLCRAMVDTVVSHHDRIRALSPEPENTVLACSTLDDEVGLVWSLPIEKPREPGTAA